MVVSKWEVCSLQEKPVGVWDTNDLSSYLPPDVS